MSREETLTFPGSDETHHFWAIKQPLRDARGEIVGVIGMSIDIQALKPKEQQLIALQYHLQAALNGCHLYQGYLFGRPMDISRFEASLPSPESGPPQAHSS